MPAKQLEDSIVNAIGARLDIAIAEGAAAIAALKALVDYVKRDGGFMYAKDQTVLRQCEALLARRGL